MRLLRNCYHMLWGTSESSNDDDIFCCSDAQSTCPDGRHLLPERAYDLVALSCRHASPFFCFLLQVLAPQWRNILPLDLVRA